VWYKFSQRVVDYTVAILRGKSVASATVEAGYSGSRSAECGEVARMARAMLMDDQEELERLASLRDLTQEEKRKAYAAKAVLAYREGCDEGE